MKANGKTSATGISTLAAVAALLIWSTHKGEVLPPPIVTKPVWEEPPVERMVVSVRETKTAEPVPAPPPAVAPEPPVVAVVEPQPISAPASASIETSPALPPKTSTSQGRPGDVGAREGAAIPIYADYRSGIGFPAYSEAMRRVGGIFLIFDGEKIRAEVDVPTRKVLPIETARLGGLSPRSREVTEPALSPCLEEARRLLGPGFYSIILLLPNRLDQHVQSEVEKELWSRGLVPSSVVQVRGRYVSNEGRLVLALTEAVSRSGGATLLQSLISF